MFPHAPLLSLRTVHGNSSFLGGAPHVCAPWCVSAVTLREIPLHVFSPLWFPILTNQPSLIKKNIENSVRHEPGEGADGANVELMSLKMWPCARTSMCHSSQGCAPHKNHDKKRDTHTLPNKHPETKQHVMVHQSFTVSPKRSVEPAVGRPGCQIVRPRESKEAKREKGGRKMEEGMEKERKRVGNVKEQQRRWDETAWADKRGKGASACLRFQISWCATCNVRSQFTTRLQEMF